MAPRKDNLADSVSILTQRQLDKFVQEYRIPLIFVRSFLQRMKPFIPSVRGSFPFILAFAQNQRPDLNVFRYFYEFITAGDWYTFAHRKGVPYPSRDERSSLKSWKDHFFWLDDRCLPAEMAWRFKDQTMSFDLGDNFVFNKELACALIEHSSPIRPLPEHFLLLGRVCFSWGQGDRDWPVFRTKRECKSPALYLPLRHFSSFTIFNLFFFWNVGTEMSLRDALKDISEPSAAEATSSVPTPTKGVAGSSGSQAGKKSILDDVESDPEVRSLDEALQYRPSSFSLKSKGVTSDAEPKGLVRKRKNEALQILPSDSLPMPKVKKNKRGASHSTGDMMTEFDEHLSGGKSSREEAARACSEPTPIFFRGFLPVTEVESMEVENPVVEGKGTIMDSSLGSDCFVDGEEDQVSSLPPSWFGPELTSFFRYADVFSDDMEIDPATADEKFVSDWDIRNKESVMDELVARTLLFNIITPLDHARTRKMKNQDLGAMVLPNEAQSNIYVTELYRR
ncbi:hypothetical protein Hdeb2414_s1196g00991131 [Helianthus debilis subsp. tardiflorus]